MAIFTGSTSSIGDEILMAAGCITGTAAVAGAAVGMTVSVSPRTYPGDGIYYEGFVSSAGVVTVKVCNTQAGYVGPSIYDVSVSSAGGTGSVDAVTATEPLLITGPPATPNISYDGGTITMLATSFLQGSATTGWQLGTLAANPERATLAPISGNLAGAFFVGPSGTNTSASVRVHNAADFANTREFRLGLIGGTAFLVLSLQGAGGTAVTLMNIGELAGSTDLTSIHFQFAGVAQAAISNAGVLGFPTVTGGLQLKSGANARVGSATLAAGSAVVANTSVTANSLIFCQNTGGGVAANVGVLEVTKTAGVGFTATSSNAADTSNFSYFIIETA